MGCCFSVRDHSNESFHGSTNSGNHLVAELHLIAHKIKGLFIATNGHHMQSSEEQAAIINASDNNEIEINSVTSHVHPTVGGENQTPEQNQGRDATLDRVSICTMSKESVLQTETEVNTHNEASENLPRVLSEQLLKTKSESYLDEECPTCLEEYEPENPKIVTKCLHHFHLSCIYAWMERSDRCPICFKLMEFDEN